MYDSFEAELEAQADKIAHVHIDEIATVDGHIMVEYWGDDMPPGIEIAPDYGYEHIGEKETGDNTKIAAFAPEDN
jgi:hypothetical protein